jgi:hypothetical protein
MRTVGCMANRQMARDLGVAPETVNRQLARLGRHCLLYHWQYYRQSPPQGPVVIDGFESFEYSQYHPFHHNLAVEARTAFVLYFTDCELRRKGRMTARQRRRREQIEAGCGRPDPSAIRKDVLHLLEVVLSPVDRATVRSDEHRAYPPALRDVPCRIRHEVTSSREARTRDNPLFVVNEADLLIRHSQSNHKRETIAFSKRRQASAERLAVVTVWRNYVKWRREKGPPASPAMLRGTMSRLVSVGEVLAARLFPARVGLPRRWQEYYDRVVATRPLKINRRHELQYAY